MVAQLETYLASQENPDQNQQDDQYEAEETLSLCDLPTYSNWDDDFSKEYQSSSFDQDEDNFFEFVSEEFTASTFSTGNKDIIFCGKLIPYNKEAPLVAAAEMKTQKKSQEPGNKKLNSTSTKKWSLFRWRRLRGSKQRPSQGKEARSARATNTVSFPASKSYRRCDLSLGKMSILSSNRSKSKWYLFMFGMARFPTEMELRDIKSRQSRRSPSTMFGAKSEASDELMGKGNKGSISDSSNRAKGLWGLLRAIGCSSQHPNAVVKSSFSS